MSEQNNKIFYRLRSLKSIFEYKELENQEIYFASLDELNDPMEGFRNVVFKEGDKSNWEIFFRHYLHCFEWAYIRLDKSKGEYDVFNNLDDMREWVERKPYTQNYSKICDDFFKICDKVIDKIASRTTPINKDELLFYLEHINFIVLEIMHKYYNPSNKNHQLSNSFDNIINKMIQKIDEIEKHISNTNNQEFAEQILNKSKPETRPVYLSLNLLNTTEMSESDLSLFATLDFPNFYLQTLEKFMYPENYIACFMEKIRNSSLWGHYGDGHKGICLIFKAINHSLVIFDKDKETTIKFEKVIYDCEPYTINLFEMIKNNPQESLEKLYRGFHIKTADWSNENEYRIVGHFPANISPTKINKKDRKLKYQFKDLYGIIFGMGTPKRDKIKIINTLKQKCIAENRKDFKIYQAYYCLKNKKMRYFLLMILDDTERKKLTL
ncbi:DUF2971 domain-containing protein [uncultured Helicobacter sp.]|uniref:DUF2971 domain-containing protein n=1 Tax=uncultured Helicobacter sp. TaxID=175537 RepID=UPI00263312CB|nr:DUF2971 domain-containing protein [uncultured Helicobacter sp.]